MHVYCILVSVVFWFPPYTLQGSSHTPISLPHVSLLFSFKWLLVLLQIDSNNYSHTNTLANVQSLNLFSLSYTQTCTHIHTCVSTRARARSVSLAHTHLSTDPTTSSSGNVRQWKVHQWSWLCKTKSSPLHHCPTPAQISPSLSHHYHHACANSWPAPYLTRQTFSNPTSFFPLKKEGPEGSSVMHQSP